MKQLTLEQQKKAIARQLSAADGNAELTQLLQEQLADIEKKIIAKGGRKATLGDGTTAGVGDYVIFVYHSEAWNHGNGHVVRERVEAVSPDGKGLSTHEASGPRRKGSYNTASLYYSTIAGALVAMREYAAKKVAEYERQVADWQRNVEDAKKRAAGVNSLTVETVQLFGLSKTPDHPDGFERV